MTRSKKKRPPAARPARVELDPVTGLPPVGKRPPASREEVVRRARTKHLHRPR